MKDKTPLYLQLDNNLYELLKIEKYRKKTTTVKIIEAALKKHFENDIRDSELLLKSQMKNAQLLRQTDVKIDVISETLLQIFKFLARQLEDSELTAEERKKKSMYVEEKTAQFFNLIKKGIEAGGTFNNTLGLGIEMYLQQDEIKNIDNLSVTVGEYKFK